MNFNTVVSYHREKGVSVRPCVHTYGDVMDLRQADVFQGVMCEKPVKSGCFQPSEVKKQENEGVKPAVSQSEEKHSVKFVDSLKCEGEAKEAPIADEPEENIPMTFRQINRDEAKNFAEYLFSKPVTFAHKCEDLMASCGTLAILCGTAAITSIAYLETPISEQIALGCVCAAGVCTGGLILSGVAGGISDYFYDRKKRMMQEQNQHIRD